MEREGNSADRRDAQRVVDALADLFDTLPPSDRAGAEEELRASGIDADRAGGRIARLAAAAMPGPSAPRAQRRGLAQRSGIEPYAAATPVSFHRRGARLIAIAAAVATAVLCWAAWRAQPEQIVRRIPVPGKVPALPARSAAVPRVEQPRNDPGAERVVAEAASAATRGVPRHTDGGASTARSDASAAAADAAQAIRSGTRGGNERTEVEALGAGSEAWILDRSNWEEARDLLPDPILQRIRAGGYRFRVQPLAADAFARHYPSVFRAASRANLERFEVSADACALRERGGTGWPASFFGLPFPVIDPEAPTAACEIMWNVEATNALGGGQDAALTFDEFATDAARPSRRIDLSLRTTAFLGRPDPLDNPDDLRSSQLVQVTAPADLAGTASLTRRSNDPTKRDAMWSFVSSIRRVRAVDPSNRSDGLLGSSIALDDFGCFDGKLEDFDWRVVGRQTVLAPMTMIGSTVQTDQSLTRAEVAVPPAKAVFETDEAGAAWLVVENLVMVPRDVWVVEAKPREKFYLAGQLVLFVDTALYRPYWLLAYARQGELLRDVMCAQRWSRSADRTAAAATASLMTGVDDAHSRATLSRYNALTLDRGQPDDSLYTIRTMTAR